ncbi:MAG: helix-turn-helix transcriptional regulator [Chitinophagaceae bacterium]|nr:helix-turn-helix transcriptional regulator [Chitinophagaceae bacterium]
MEDNFCFNLKLEVFARLSNRSLSAYKRDFLRLYHTTPGKWLLEKRLHNAKHLLSHLGKTVAEAAYESGFENVSHFSRAYKNVLTPHLQLCCKKVEGIAPLTLLVNSPDF